MPAFIKTPADEKKWNDIKHSIAKQKGKNVADFTENDWAEVNGIWHKCEGSMLKAEELIKSLNVKIPTTSIPNPAKVGVTSVKMPKAKKPADPFGKQSLFFKNEDLSADKTPSIEKLKRFFESTRTRKQSFKG